MKKKLLVFASTFPRWENDTIPPFVYELSRRLMKGFDEGKVYIHGVIGDIRMFPSDLNRSLDDFFFNSLRGAC